MASELIQSLITSRTIPVYPVGIRDGETESDVEARQHRDGLGWRFGGVGEWSTDDIVKTFHGLGINIDAANFRDVAVRYPSMDALIAEFDDLFPINDLWIDFCVGGIVTLWKRLAPDVLVYDLIADYLDDMAESLSDFGEPDTEFLFEQCKCVADFFEAFVSDEAREQFLLVEKGCIYDPVNTLEDCVRWLGDIYPDEMHRLTKVMCAVDPEKASIFVDSLLDAYDSAPGNYDKVRPLVDDLIRTRPDDWTSYDTAWTFAFDSGDQVGMVEHAVSMLDRIKEPSDWDDKYDMVASMLVEEGRRDLAQQVADRVRRPIALDQLFAPQTLRKEKPVVVVHIGRNDPCPCGSGKKYKKCCLP